MNPTPEQIAKLPKWAQEHIVDLARQRAAAVQALNEATNRVQPAPFYFTDTVHTGEASGPSFKKFYVNTRRMSVEHAGIQLDVFLPEPDDGQRLYGIELTYRSIGGRGLTDRMVGIMPRSINSVQLAAKEFLR